MKILGQEIISQGGDIIPLVLPHSSLNAPSSSNVSVLSVNNKLLINIRNLNYVLYHAENTKNAHSFGPLVYIHPESDVTLTTYNYVCELDDKYNINAFSMVDTSRLDVAPLWEFIGLEDARLVFWDNKLWQCGVRRDTTTNGVGRMELVEIEANGSSMLEKSRTRMPAPPPDDSYCEKNWMPITDMPYHFVKWTNSTEVVKYDFSTNQTTTVIGKDYVDLGTADLRGGSQVIPYKDHYICIVHEVNLYSSQCGRKDAHYWHRAVVWDKHFNILRVSEPFSFMDGKIEFCVGLTIHENQFFASFGFQDNAAYLARIPFHIIDGLLSL